MEEFGVFTDFRQSVEFDVDAELRAVAAEIEAAGRVHKLGESATRLVRLFDAFEPHGSTEWQELALCAQTDPEAFFPERGGSVREAKNVCQQCEVRDECLQFALENDEQFGVWGGKSEHQRRKMKLKRRTV